MCSFVNRDLLAKLDPQALLVPEERGETAVQQVLSDLLEALASQDHQVCRDLQGPLDLVEREAREGQEVLWDRPGLGVVLETLFTSLTIAACVSWGT